MKLSWLLESVAGRGEAICHETYREIVRDHLHEVIQLAAEWVTEKRDEIAEALEEAREAEANARELNRNLDDMREERDQLAAELAGARARISVAETQLQELRS